MSLTLFHHPYSRASGVVWALEEVGQPYVLRYVDIHAGEQKKTEFLAKNPMGKLPTLLDGATVLTESAAISLYLADRYAPGRLAPSLDDPRRAAFLRWSFFAPSVVEPSVMAKLNSWSFREVSAGWGNHDSVLVTLKKALEGSFILGQTFSMADVVLGSTLRTLLQFDLIEPEAEFVAYVGRLTQRPALQRADARNAAVAREHGLEPN
ncbi:MAG: glutathione S-transferase family protein [Myxococcota bacterium]